MGVYKGTKNNQNIWITPGLSHMVECNLIQEYAHTRKTKTKQKMDNHWQDQNASIYAGTD